MSSNYPSVTANKVSLQWKGGVLQNLWGSAPDGRFGKLFLTQIFRIDLMKVRFTEDGSNFAIRLQTTVTRAKKNIFLHFMTL